MPVLRYHIHRGSPFADNAANQVVEHVADQVVKTSPAKLSRDSQNPSFSDNQRHIHQ